MMLIEFDVTQDDIDNGIAGDCKFCAVALGLDRKIKELSYNAFGTMVIFSTSLILDKYNEKICFLENSAKIMDFIEKFDKGLPVEPTTFTIDIPQLI